MDQKLRVTSIVLTTANGMRVELTIPEARDLHEQLAKMFGKNLVNTPVIIERHHWPMPWRNNYQHGWNRQHAKSSSNDGRLQIPQETN
jgi:hypothetical protein